MGYQLISSAGNIQSGEKDYSFLPDVSRGSGKYGVIELHGAATNDMFAGTSWPAASAIGARLASKGTPAIAGDMGGDTFGNATGMARITAAAAYLSSVSGCSTAKYHLLGASMGAMMAYTWAAQNPTKVASICAIIPGADLNKLMVGYTPGGYTTGFMASIAAAWSLTARSIADLAYVDATHVSAASFTSADVGRSLGSVKCTYPTKITAVVGTTATLDTPVIGGTGWTGQAAIVADALPSGAKVINNVGPVASASIPNMVFYSTVDPYIFPADAQALATAAGGTSIAIDSTYGHANGTVVEFDVYNNQANADWYVNWVQSLGG